MRLLKLMANVIIWTIPPSIICISITRQWRQCFKRVNRGRLSREKDNRPRSPFSAEYLWAKRRKKWKNEKTCIKYTYIFIHFLSQLWYDNDVELNTYCPFRGETCRSRSAKCQLGLENWFWSACSVVLSLAATRRWKLPDRFARAEGCNWWESCVRIDGGKFETNEWKLNVIMIEN